MPSQLARLPGPMLNVSLEEGLRLKKVDRTGNECRAHLLLLVFACAWICVMATFCLLLIWMNTNKVSHQVRGPS